MPRGLLAFVFVAILLSGSAVACGAPAATTADTSVRQAQATNVRRTEVAAAQAIIANNPTATSTIAPTPAPSPACQASGAIWWYEARTHPGESRTVQGVIVATRTAPGGMSMLEMGQRYPDPTGLAVLIPASSGSTLDGKTICVAGKITKLEGVPTMQLHDTSTIAVINT